MFTRKHTSGRIRDKKWFRTAVICLAAILSWWLAMFFSVPRPTFDVPYSTLAYSRGNELIGARAARDGQWRFPETDSLPDKFIQCLVAYEDKRFFIHPGIDPLAIARAVRLNSRSGTVVSGGSTLTMQLARIARGNKDRTVIQKFIEANLALYFETIYSKDRILRLYASHAPFGGNVIGAEAASWRYFGREIADLSWAECATLAVLPNSPALIHPGRNRSALKDKRDALLLKLYGKGAIDRTGYELALLEELPEKPHELPNDVPHLMERLSRNNGGEKTRTSINRNLQRNVQNIVNRHGSRNSSKQIHNLAAIVADTETGEVLAYAGNVTFAADPRHGNNVDIITSPRSTGSILKPFLYAGMLHDGSILPNTLVSDTPLNINGFMPQNYNRTFNGAVSAGTAITRSLNVPLVRMLSSYNTGRFMSLLKNYGMTTLYYSEDHYGSSIILGGAEGTLWDMAGMYASMARALVHHEKYSGRYDKRDIHPLRLTVADGGRPIIAANDPRLSDEPVLSAAAIWFTFEAMSDLNRPEEEADWQQFGSMKRIAWKTGTSWGGRDGWAIGVTPRYVVGVWVGNASGEGRAGLTGVGDAAPVMLDIFALLPESGWFAPPYGEMEKKAVCRQSGHLASELCSPVDSLYVPVSGLTTPICAYHKRVHLSADGWWQVNSSCESVADIVTTGWFVLPPAQEYYYRIHNPDYKVLPPLKPGCRNNDGKHSIDIIYPEHNATVVIPRGLSGKREKVIFSAAHAEEDAAIFWYIDEEYIATTRELHQIAVIPSGGTHILHLVDNNGNERKIFFSVRE